MCLPVGKYLEITVVLLLSPGIGLQMMLPTPSRRFMSTKVIFDNSSISIEVVGRLWS